MEKHCETMDEMSQPTTQLLNRLNPIDIALFVRALGLARTAQRVSSDPIRAVVQEMSRNSGGLRFSHSRLEMASTRAVSRWKRWFGGVDTCLTRSLVFGALLAGCNEVSLNVGFRPGEEEPSIDGHAWVTVDGKAVGSDGSLSKERYTRVIEIPFSRESGAE
jgi:hypothetical protein